jgi:glucose-1-phosphate cytidylyltransferase
MKTIILAGGMGSRLAEETRIRPKPMVEIGGYPILWHIMQYFSAFNYNEFVVALGYRGEYIKRFMSDFCTLAGNLRIDLANSAIEARHSHEQKWIVDLVDTGQQTQTGGRIKRLEPFIGTGTFFAAWGDGLYNVDLNHLLDFHRQHGKLATVVAVRPPARFGQLNIENAQVVRYVEKPQMSEGWVSGGLFALEPGVLKYIEGDLTQWEIEPLERLSSDGQLMAYCHDGFWQCMDTLRDKVLLESMWDTGKAPWKVFE